MSAVRCYHCGSVTSVAAKAMSASCCACHKSLDIQDIRIKAHHWGGVLCTCGSLVIGRKARVSAKIAVASLRAEVMGKFEGILVCGGPVLIGSRADLSGAVWAPSVCIEDGAIVRGVRFVVPCDPLGQVEINATRGSKPSEPPARAAG